MKNNSTDLFKILQLSNLDIDFSKTTTSIENGGMIINIPLFLNIKSRICPYCHSKGLQIKDTVINRLFHPVMPDKKITIFFHRRKFKCKECIHVCLQENPISTSSITSSGVLYLLNQFRNPRFTFKEASTKFFIPISSIIRLT